MIRRALTAVTLAAAATVVTVLPGVPAFARACQAGFQCYTDYYSTSAHTTLVGGKFEDCDGDISRWGVISGYKTFSETPC